MVDLGKCRCNTGRSNKMEAIILIILAAVVAVSEALALIPALKSNSILQLVSNIAKKLLGRK